MYKCYSSLFGRGTAAPNDHEIALEQKKINSFTLNIWLMDAHNVLKFPSFKYTEQSKFKLQIIFRDQVFFLLNILG
jgi:hypothetical protein